MNMHSILAWSQIAALIAMSVNLLIAVSADHKNPCVENKLKILIALAWFILINLAGGL